jgi:hypothetical protein
MFDSRPLLCAGLAAGLMCALTACEVRRTDVRPRRSAIAAPGAISPPSAGRKKWWRRIGGRLAMR